KIPVDPSYHRAALYLAERKQAGQVARITNFGPEIAHYCAWFAPGLPYFADARWQLFPDEVPQLLKARAGLAVNEPEAWQKTFLEHKIDWMVLTNGDSRSRDVELAVRLWRDQPHWLIKYADGKTIVFAWSGPDKSFDSEFSTELNRRAFG